jgi:hypothetical protein
LVYLTTIFNGIGKTTSNDNIIMYDELERIRKEPVEAYFKVCHISKKLPKN